MNNKQTITEKEPKSKELAVHINPSITPIYADDIVQLNFDIGTAKLLLAQRYEQNAFHTTTIALPTQALVSLKKMLDSEEFDKIIEELQSSLKS